MKIVIVQLAAKLGDFQYNATRADELLKGINGNQVDLLVLPELALTGYNFPDLESIKPHLERTADGPTTHWATRTAKRLSCTVIIGYPELCKCADPTSPTTTTTFATKKQAKTIFDFAQPPESPAFQDSSWQTRFNSVVVVDAKGDVVGHYRKTFLYATDETWAHEGHGFFKGTLRLPPFQPDATPQPPVNGMTSYLAAAPVKEEVGVKTAMGVCMDINPYKFEAPWTAYEYARHCINAEADLVINVNAFLTAPPPSTTTNSPSSTNSTTHNSPNTSTTSSRASSTVRDTRSRSELIHNEPSEADRQPDMHTLSYWIARLKPMTEKPHDRRRVVVCANRTGAEGTATYAGTSCVMCLEGGGVALWGVMGRGEEGVLVCDTSRPPQLKLVSSPQQQQEVNAMAEEKEEEMTGGRNDEKMHTTKLREPGDEGVEDIPGWVRSADRWED